MVTGPDSLPTSHDSLRVVLGDPARADHAIVAAPGLPVLRGPEAEVLFPDARPCGSAGPFRLMQTDGVLLGMATVDPGGALPEATRLAYAAMLEAAAGWHLARIWNYVPAINQPGHDGLENYRAFSAGRSLAFEEALGDGYKARLPAASAVGTRDARLTIVFAASREPVLHRENPVQVPAYDYPEDYGPRAPSFARATVVPAPGGRRDVYISGTAAIRGHTTVAPRDTGAQVTCTLENLRAIARACGLGDDLAAGRAVARQAKVYLRHADDLDAIAAQLDAALWRPGDRVTYLHADICRAELNLEIEITLSGVLA